jgi:hypothetical protein
MAMACTSLGKSEGLSRLALRSLTVRSQALTLWTALGIRTPPYCNSETDLR